MKILLLFILLFIITVSHAANIKGKVSESITGASMEGTLLYLKGTNINTIKWIDSTLTAMR